MAKPGSAGNNKQTGSQPGDAIVENQRVRSEMERAFRESGDNAASLSDVHEQGGWIIRNKDGSSDVQRWQAGTSGGIRPSSQPNNAIAHFHTHPYGKTEGFYHGPSAYPQFPNDYQTTINVGMPGFVIDRVSIFRIETQCNGCYHDITKY